MKLSRVVLSGFKTFAERTEVRFEPGITAVVGANGTGKSNLVDAVRWALGETSARELRGSRLDEVIYAGGQGRARMGVADVELVLDNQDGGLPVDDLEVALSRRVARGGDIEYRINGQRARLRDVERLLSRTGLTQHGYSVVAQHDIEAIIEATPRQRRALVEQAAGVRPVRCACDDALHRLEGVDAAVQRLEERLGEAEPRLAELSVESRAALEQRELAERLSHLRGSLAREEWRAARAQLRQTERRLEGAERRLEAATEAEAAFSARLEAERGRLEAARRSQRRAGERLEAARVEAERSAGEVRRFADRARGAVLHRADAQGQRRVAELEAEAADRGLAALGDLALDGIAEQSSAVAELAARLAVAEAEAQAAEGELEEQARAASRCAEASVRARTAADERAGARALAERGALEAAEELSAAQGRGEAAEREAAAARRALDQVHEAALAAEQDAELRALELAQVRAGLRRAEEALLEEEERAAALVTEAATLRGRADGAVGGAGVIAGRAAELRASRLIDHLRVVDPADGAAVEAALEPHLAAWLVEDVDGALELLRSAPTREEVLTASAPAWLETTSEGGRQAAAEVAGLGGRPALAAVEVDGVASAAAAHCLDGAWLVSDLAQARRVLAIAGGRAILPDGAVITRGGARAGVGAGALALAEAARQAEVAAAQARSGEADARGGVRRLSTRVGELETAASAADSVLASRRREDAAASARWARAESFARTEESRVRSLQVELERRRAAAVAAAAAAEASGLEVERWERRGAEADQRVSEMRERVAALRERSLSLSEDLATVEHELAEARREAEAIARRRAEAAEARRLALARVAELEGRVTALETEVLIALAHGAHAAAAARRLEEEVAGSAAELARISVPLDDAETRLAAIESERGEVSVAVARAEDEVAAARQEMELARARLAEMADAVREEAADEEAELDPAAAEKAEREIARLERRIGSMGPVNALAPEQHGALAERVIQLRGDRDDLALAAREVRNLARRLGAEAGRRFEAVFGAVSANFAELFTELFGGGRAALHLETELAAPDGVGPDRAVPLAAAVEPADPEADEEALPGVQILAQPPGKRLQPLTHLSGGERAMTALAVVLALQQVNPSPFYIFDEVDAPLDDLSVSRFAGLLTRLARHQQFVVVTHNHLTMAAADALYGVTADRQGVSAVVSVRFPEGEETIDTVGLIREPLRRVAS
ncbi:MAG TPA: chromosome segregation protein SMC [Candidatus Binatia bacterium]|nr:chromosome segregation protein SMC [Candidatus Binatia bacterium]